MMTSGLTERGRYEGLLQVLRYNQPFYTWPLGFIAASILLAPWMTPAVRTFLAAAIVLGAFWICFSLLVSHYVYDRSRIYSLSWLRDCLSRTPARWVNIHSGVDDTSHVLASLFPGSEGLTLDIYDPQEMREPSIERARRLRKAAAPNADWRALPVGNEEFDTAFLVFAAHELRHHEARVQLFREVSRALRSGGEAILVEHLRDWANWLAFGPGFLHFFSERTWLRAAAAAGFRLQRRRSLTPFVRVLTLEKVR